MQFFRRSLRALAAVLAVCLLACACGTSSPTSSAAPEQLDLPDYVRSGPVDVDFDAIDYERPDVDALNGKIDRALSLAADDAVYDTLVLYDEILKDISVLETMDSFASIQYNLDLSNTFYQQEELALDEAYTRLDNRMNELTGAILDSRCAEAARAHWGDAFIERYERNCKLNSKEIEELSVQEQALVSEYLETSAAEFTAERGGETVTIDDLDLTQNGDVMLYYEIQQKRNAEMGQLYRELMQVRVEIAQKLGYESYADYAYDLLGRDFTKEDAAAFSAAVKEWLVPVSEAIFDLHYSDCAEARARADVTLEDGIPVLEQALQEGGYPAKMLEALRYMQKNNLSNLGGGANRMAAGYTTILSQYAAPFLFINTDAYTDPSTLFHEFGHYYNFYLMGETMWNDGNNLDLAEIHSQGLELLMMDTYPSLYGDDAPELEYWQLMNFVDAILQACAEDEFQQRMFEDPEMSLEDMNLLHAQLYQEYMGYPLVYEWVDIHHHFETPFYYISYGTSAVSALELWADARENRAHALDIYDQLTQRTINVAYRETLREVGLSDPFTSDCVERLAKTLDEEMGLGLFAAKAA